MSKNKTNKKVLRCKITSNWINLYFNEVKFNSKIANHIIETFLPKIDQKLDEYVRICTRKRNDSRKKAGLTREFVQFERKLHSEIACRIIPFLEEIENEYDFCGLVHGFTEVTKSLRMLQVWMERLQKMRYSRKLVNEMKRKVRGKVVPSSMKEGFELINLDHTIMLIAILYRMKSGEKLPIPDFLGKSYCEDIQIKNQIEGATKKIELRIPNNLLKKSDEEKDHNYPYKLVLLYGTKYKSIFNNKEGKEVVKQNSIKKIDLKKHFLENRTLYVLLTKIPETEWLDSYKQLSICIKRFLQKKNPNRNRKRILLIKIFLGTEPKITEDERRERFWDFIRTQQTFSEKNNNLGFGLVTLFHNASKRLKFLSRHTYNIGSKNIDYSFEPNKYMRSRLQKNTNLNSKEIENLIKKNVKENNKILELEETIKKNFSLSATSSTSSPTEFANEWRKIQISKKLGIGAGIIFGPNGVETWGKENLKKASKRSS